MLHHMLDNKNKNMILAYCKLKNILAYSGFDLEEEEQKILHSKIGKGIMSKIGYNIHEREIVSLSLRSGRQQRNNNLLSILLKLYQCYL